MKKTLALFAVVLGCGAFAGAADAALSAGSILPIGINTSNSLSGGSVDWLAMVALANIPAGEVFYLTDNELTSGSATAFNTGESFTSFTAPVGGISAGTVFSIGSFDSSLPVASIGSAAVVSFTGSSNRGLSTTADTVYLYQAASAASVDTPTSYLAYINIGNATDGFAPTGLSLNFQVAFTSGMDSAVYSGARSGQATFGDYAALISNPGNWTTATGETTLATLNTTSFAAVPEPATVGMVGLGLAGLLLMVRPRHRV